MVFHHVDLRNPSQAVGHDSKRLNQLSYVLPPKRIFLSNIRVACFRDSATSGKIMLKT